ncbi:hypothetical protein MBLNU230_g1404t1 [Neophaeotheca triangularis]
MRVRVRGPQGVATINIEDSATWQDLLNQIAEKTGVSTDFDLKYGYPPQPLNTETIDTATPLSALETPLDGEQLIVNPRNIQADLSKPVEPTPNPQAVKPLPGQNLNPPQHQPGDFPTQPPNPSPTRQKPNSLESDPPEIPVPQLEGSLTLRIMPDDNSCLFRALSSAVLGSSLDGMTELRSIVAQTIQAQPDFYTAGLLEKEPSDYCRWIQNENSWGGGIELSILSQHFELEVCSINVQDGRVDRFNERQPRRCVLVYSGIHYDVCAVTPFAGAPPEMDRKVFDVLRLGEGEEVDGGVLEAAGLLCGKLREQHYFTDTAGFDVRCNVCGTAGKGQMWAVEHARGTGHGDFGEA